MSGWQALRLPPIRKALDYAIQIARGFAAAHDRGIVHRDLKPENVFITSDGRVKILDFGLAKLMTPEAEHAHQARTLPHSGPNLASSSAPVGYMSPQQVRGLATDHRSDIFSFGAILYELLTGKRAFEGSSAVETLSAILKEEPAELVETGRNPARRRACRDSLPREGPRPRGFSQPTTWRSISRG